MAKKMKNQNPPRRVEIRGQDHLLAYITPAEAQLLMDNGGTGEPGPMGIPAFYEKDRPGLGGVGERPGGGGNFDGAGFGVDFDGPNSGGGTGTGGNYASPAAAERAQRLRERLAKEKAMQEKIKAAEKAKQEKIKAAAAKAMEEKIKAAAEKAMQEKIKAAEKAEAARIAGELARQRIAEENAKIAAEAEAKRAAEKEAGLQQVYDDTDYGAATQAQIDEAVSAAAGNIGGERTVGGLTRAQYGAMPSYMKAMLDPESPFFTGAYNYDIDPVTGKVLGFTGPSILGFTPSIAGLLTNLMPQPTTEAELGGVYTGFGRMGEGPEFMGGSGREDVVEAQTSPITGQKNQCPEGYVFDEDLQACRMAGGLPTYGDVVGGTGFDYAPGTYARMGLLDVAPTGLPEFAGQYGTGFGTPQDFEAANLAYRRRAGTMGGIFQDPYNLQGYTLLS